MGENASMSADLAALRRALAIGEFVPSSAVMPPMDTVLRHKGHGYRRVDAHTLVHLMDFEVTQPYSLKLDRLDQLCIQATLAGRYSRTIGQRHDIVESRILQISNAPSSVAEVAAGGRLRGVLIAIDRAHLIDHYRLRPELLPPAYRPLFLSRDGLPEVLKLPLSSACIGLVDQMLGCRYAEPLRGIFLGAKVLELVCEIVSELHRVNWRLQPRNTGEASRAQAIETAAAIYRREIGQPPTIEQIARRVGLNRNDLTGGFRARFGLTPHAFAQLQRMTRAQELLRDGRLSISEIARQIGYEGYSSFARAYHAHFGEAPAHATPAAEEL